VLLIALVAAPLLTWGWVAMGPGSSRIASTPGPPGQGTAAPLRSTEPAEAASSPAQSTASAGPTAPTGPTAPNGPFAGGLLIADRGNGRIIAVDNSGRIIWSFPIAGSLPTGEAFSADDAFLSPDGQTLTANEEGHQVVVRIDIATRRVVWEYGHYGRAGSLPGYLNTPDDAYGLANGDVVIADIGNCRVIEISPDKQIVRQWGQTGVCTHRPPVSYAVPNGDTPLPDGGLLITEIRGSRVVRLDAAGNVVFDIHVPAKYPSDAQLDTQGNVVVADYTNPGAVLAVDPQGRLLWRYGPTAGAGRLDHPSLAIPLPDGTIAVTDDGRARVVVLDPGAGRIVWQYGTTDSAGIGPGRLADPDGLEPIPVGVIPGL
jgi:outer membrane protein assembly factor BamB